MPYREKVIRKVIHPPEAGAVAAQFRHAADQVDELAVNLESMGAALEPNWEGNSKNKFFAQFDPTPGQVQSVARTLRRLADEIERITVVVERTVMEHYD
jgi:WXG100 family type VII secretion target